ncbi:immunoglobulin kappa light chain-like [Labeo rohita]|uniref:immunoglobulin kappa light chain-like n=1 Tax=Labeo rohita TaxID=84645 RepID=UPI0021E338F6|nr:immunoglobulin kappa light chain-like [Labeo rohita]
MEEVQSPESLSVKAGDSVFIRFTGTSGVGSDMSWHLQKPRESPKLLISQVSELKSGVLDRFSGNGYYPDFILNIHGDQTEDAGVYYCSVGQTVTQSEDQAVEPHQTVTIHCNHKPAVNLIKPGTSQYCMSWYHQIPGEVPKLLIYYTSDRASGVSSRFSGSESGNHMDFILTISGVQPEDSGVYYCQSLYNKGVSGTKDWVFTQCKSIVQKPTCVRLQRCSFELLQMFMLLKIIIHLTDFTQKHRDSLLMLNC